MSIPEDSVVEEGTAVVSPPSQEQAACSIDAGGVAVTDNVTEAPKCCGCLRFQGKSKAQGFALASMGHGSVFVSNVFLSSSFIFLANQQAGCVDAQGEIIDDCSERIYGFKPSALSTNIATFASLLAALLLPTIGAIIDFTPHRKRVGQIVACGMVLINAAQIGTVSSTWFGMAILQAVMTALYQMHSSISNAYLPDIARWDVNEETFVKFNRVFYILQFGGEMFLMIVVVALATAFEFDTVQTAQLGQVIISLWMLLAFGGAWKCFPTMPRRHALPQGHALLWEGFRQNWRTAYAILQQSKTLKWFFLAVIVGEAGTSALLAIAVTILVNVLKFDATQVGIAFLLALVGTMPGLTMNVLVCRRFNPIISSKLALGGMVMWTTFAMVNVDGLAESNFVVMGNVYCFVWGLLMGWWYSGEQLLFSFLMPHGQESELAGFFIYCTVIFIWFPPLIFSIIVEQDLIQQTYGLSTLIACQAAGIACLFMMPRWDECIESAQTPLVIFSNVADDGQGEGVATAAAGTTNNDHDDEKEDGLSDTSLTLPAHKEQVE